LRQRNGARVRENERGVITNRNSLLNRKMLMRLELV
jgi:hypothetical protein